MITVYFDPSFYVPVTGSPTVQMVATKAMPRDAAACAPWSPEFQNLELWRTANPRMARGA